MLKMHLLLPFLALPLATAQLNELAQAAGKLYFGTATDNGELNNTEYFSILTDTKEFGQLTPANGMKWFAVEPFQNVFNFSDGAVVADLATKHHQILRCHNLVWENQLAPWVTATNWTKETLTQALEEHVTREASHWAGQCYAWDVVNEALNDDGTYRNDTFLEVLGPDYLKIAFRTAAKADPQARLYYNDYNIEFPGNKSTAVLEKIVKLLQDDDIRIDGIGMQSHFTTGESPTMEQQIATMQSYVAQGLEVAITELDVKTLLPVNDTELQQQAQAYSDAVGACMSVDQCVGITVWDFYDPFSWIPGTFPGFGDGDLWFENFTKHPAYDGVVEALKSGKSKKHRKARGFSWAG